MSRDGDTKIDSELVEGPPSGGLDARAMRGRLAARLFGEDAGDVSIGRFEVLESIGIGGMGVVYLAADPKLQRQVALKLLHPTAVGSDVERLRLTREAQALARLSHPNVVQLYEVGEHRGSVFLAMEYVGGESLREWQAAAKRTWRETLTQYVQAGEGLAAAHEAGLVHRDFKPANVIVGTDGRVRVADFGLARGPGLSSQSSGGLDSADASHRSPADATITRPGSVIGTPAYMSPEQTRGDPVDARSDQFTFCVALWEALHGERPYSAAALRGEGTGGAPRGSNREVPRWLERALLRGLSLRPEDRFPRMRDLGECLTRGLRPRSGVAALGVAALVFAVAAAAIASAGRDDLCHDAPALGEVWDDARRAQVQASLEPLGGFGATAWPSLERGVDAYADQWRVRAGTLCSDDPGSTAGEAGGWRRCLERSKRQLDYSIGLLGSGDRDIVANAAKVFAALPDVEECVASTSLAERPVDPAARRELDRARVQLALGRPQRALEALVGQQMAAASVADRGFAAELGVAEGDALRELGRIDAAAEHYERALANAMADGSDTVVTDALRELADLEASSRENIDAAERWLALGEASAERTGGAAVERVRLLLTAARVARRASRPDEALAKARRAVDEARKLPSRSAPLLARALRESAFGLVSLGHLDEARVTYGEARSFHERAFGAEHAEMAELELGEGLLERAAGDPSAALEHFERAYAIQREVYGDDSPRLARPMTALGEALANTGDIDRAEALARRAWKLQMEGFPLGHSERGGALFLIAALEMAQGRTDLYVERLKLLAGEWDTGANRGQLPMVVNNIGYYLCELRRCAEAEYFYEWLRDLVEPGSGMDSFARLGLVRVEVGRTPPGELLARIGTIRSEYVRRPAAEQRADFIDELDELRAAVEGDAGK